MNVTMILSVCDGTVHLMVKELKVDLLQGIAIDQSQSHRLVSKETVQDEVDRGPQECQPNQKIGTQNDTNYLIVTSLGYFTAKALSHQPFFNEKSEPVG